MANEKRACNQLCHWNDSSDGCVKPYYVACPMSNTEPDYSGTCQANEKPDLISRSALLAEYDRVHVGEPGKARKLIEDAPTVDAVPVVHGRWIEGRKGRYICSVCRGESGLYGGGIGQNLSNYCPNCGSQMDGGDRE